MNSPIMDELVSQLLRFEARLGRTATRLPVSRRQVRDLGRFCLTNTSQFFRQDHLEAWEMAVTGVLPGGKLQTILGIRLVQV
jgi:hypothetical protein